MRGSPTTLQIDLARTPDEVEASRAMVEAVYGERYGVTFVDSAPDPQARREPWPDRWATATVGTELVAVAGLYVDVTYVERFGGVSRADIEAVAASRGAVALGRPVVEYTKLVVAPAWEGRGIGSTFLAVTHSRGFLAADGGPTPLVLACGKLSVFAAVYFRAGIVTHTIAAFPSYASHERYRSNSDPMESRLVVPELDLDPIVGALKLPISLDLATGGRRVA